MGIFRRVSDIVSANLNELVDGFEDPEKMLKQAIREMEEAISKARPDVAKAMANRKTVAKELAANEAEVEAWEQSAAAAVESGDDELARKSLGRKREYQKIVDALGDQLEAAGEAAGTLRRQLEAMQAKLKEAERRLGTLAARKKAADLRTKVAQSQGHLNADLDQNAFDKFDRLEKKVEMAEAEAEAMAELARAESTEDDPRLASEDLEIEADLAALKRRKGQP